MFSEKDISLAFEKLKPYWNEIEAEHAKKEEYFQSLMNKNYSDIAQLLKCHLIIEHYLDIFLKEELGLSHLDDAKLSFFNKMNLLPNNQAVGFVKPGIIKLNSLRNKVAHQLDIKFTKEDLGSINNILKIARKDIEKLSFIEAIETFTAIACTWLSPKNETTQKYISESLSHINFKNLNK